jgi:hypothetical protein
VICSSWPDVISQDWNGGAAPFSWLPSRLISKDVHGWTCHSNFVHCPLETNLHGVGESVWGSAIGTLNEAIFGR